MEAPIFHPSIIRKGLAAKDFGLGVSFTKTKVMTAGWEVTDTDEVPLDVGYKSVENVKEFPYLNWFSCNFIGKNGRRYRLEN